MGFEKMKIMPLDNNVWLLDDGGMATCYVVCGTEYAMVIDTVNGLEDLHEIVRTITDLPLIVVNTHGHPDHIYGNAYFDEAWIHPDDEKLAEFFFDMVKDKAEAMGLRPCPFRYLSIGQIFDLGGGNELEVISLKGHTVGSIGLLDRKRRILFTGDGLNPHIWMQLDHSTEISVLMHTLEHVKSEYGKDFDLIFFGHAHEGYFEKGIDKSLIDQLLCGCRELLDGRTQNDTPYKWNDIEPLGTSKMHCYDENDTGKAIIYTDAKLK